MFYDYPNNIPANEDFSRNIEIERLIYELQENRRRINNLLKRITRLESYLRIKDEDSF